jgi:6-methylsalicylate decarboxylase
MSFTVDVHQHILADAFWRATNDAHSPVGGILPAPWSKESTLSYMDEAGIDVAITSISTLGVHVGDDSAARDLARRVNELSAELMQEPPNVSADSRRYLCPTSTAHCARWNTAWTFSDWTVSYFSPTCAACISAMCDSGPSSTNWKGAELSHPTPSPDPAARNLGLPDSLIDFTADTTRAVAQLHYGNTFARTPNVKYIFSHAGSTIPIWRHVFQSSTR